MKYDASVFDADNLNGYQVKSDSELLDNIGEFGCGEMEFHTADVERIITQKQALQEKIEHLLLVLGSKLADDEILIRNARNWLPKLKQEFKTLAVVPSVTVNTKERK